MRFEIREKKQVYYYTVPMIVDTAKLAKGQGSEDGETFHWKISGCGYIDELKLKFWKSRKGFCGP